MRIYVDMRDWALPFCVEKCGPNSIAIGFFCVWFVFYRIDDENY